jgi:hypothetical protein
MSLARKRAIRHREAMLAPLKTLSGKRTNSFRPRFTANNRSRPLHMQAAREAQALACPFGRPLSNEAVRCVPLVGLDARTTSLVGLMRRCVRRSPSRLRFSSGIGVAIGVPDEGGAGCTASLSAFASEDAPYRIRPQARYGLAWIVWRGPSAPRAARSARPACR